MKKIYISGGISGIDPDKVRQKFDDAAKRVRDQGDEPLNPLYNGLGDGLPWISYMRVDIILLMQADAILMLKGWETSRGATIEHNLCQSLGIPINYDNH